MSEDDLVNEEEPIEEVSIEDEGLGEVETLHLLRDRFKKDVSKAVRHYTESISYDRRLYQHDIAGSAAHVRMLARQGIVSNEDAEMILKALDSVREEIENGSFVFRDDLEDIHMSIEARVIDKIGEVGRKIHTARSRNDQVTLDMRLYTKDVIALTVERLRLLQSTIVNVAEANKEVIMPGYTHLQRAQPVLFAHHLLAYFEMLQRDIGRFRDCLDRADVLTLGSGALAGVPYPIDRDFLAGELGFNRISDNSMDAVSDRDYVIEYEAAAAVTMMHLSRLSEELIMWSSAEFGFIDLDDSCTTGSSIMPQKKNPDIAELARGKTGRVYGHLTAMLTIMKGLPLSYNRDMQEDKEGFFDTVDTLLDTLEVFTGMVSTLQIGAEVTRRAAGEGYILATDLADYLVGKGVSFRKAHGVVGSLVQYAIEMGKTFKQLSLSEYKNFSPLFEEDVYELTPDSSIAARNVPGGTASAQVEKQISWARRVIEGGNA
ncbi:MAG: argininosuccinate lyase [Chloroflexota bacterium]|nr:argininosuccinate lyase [Chloroflexota bacterium]